MMAGRTRLLDIVVVDPPRGSLVAFCTIAFPSGLILSDVTIHRQGGRCWASPPSRPWLKGTELVLDVNGKIQWSPIIRFQTHGVRSSWSRQIIAAVRAEHPELLPDAEGAA